MSTKPQSGHMDSRHSRNCSWIRTFNRGSQLPNIHFSCGFHRPEGLVEVNIIHSMKQIDQRTSAGTCSYVQYIPVIEYENGVHEVRQKYVLHEMCTSVNLSEL